MRAFFDITGNAGELYLLDNKTDRVIEKIPFSIDEGYSITLEGGRQLPAGIDESVVSLPLNALNFRVLELPLSDPAKIKDVLPFELEGLILGKPEDYVIDSVTLKDGRVLAVYVEKRVMKKLLDGLSQRGIDPVAVTSLDAGYAFEASESVDTLTKMLIEGTDIEPEERVRRAVAEIGKSSFNFRTGELSYRKETEKAKKQLRLAAAALILISLIWAGDTAVRAVYAKKEAKKLEAGIAKIYSGFFPSEKIQSADEAVLRMKSRLKETTDKDTQIAGVKPLDVMLRLQNAARPGLAIQSITLDRELAVLKGDASSLSEVQKFKEALDGLFNEVKISETGQSAKDKTAFTITAKGKKP